MINDLMIILSIHWFADFFCQTDDMATKKSKENAWLSYHVIAYTSVTFFLSFVLLAVQDTRDLVVWAALNGVIHFMVDFVTSRVTSKLWNDGEVHWFFVVVGLDQLIHFISLFLTYNWLLR